MRERFARLTVDTSPLRVSPAYRRFWIGSAIKDLGGEVILVALPFQVYLLTGSTLAVGLLSFVELVPLLTLTIVGGAIADAVDRRRLLLLTQAGMALAGVALLVNAALPHPRVWPLFVFGFVAASFFCLGIGGLRSLTPRLIPADKIPAASALESVSSSLGAVAGPALAGIMIGQIGVTSTYAFDLVTFAIGIATFWSLPPIEPVPDADRPSLRSILDGFRYVRTRPVIMGFFLVDTNAMIFGMPSALFPALATHRFGNPSLVGYLYAAPYAGALLSSLLSGWVNHVRRQGRAVAVAAAAWGVAIALFGFTHTLWLGLVMLAVAGAADNISAVFRSTIMLTATPDELRGRLTGIEFAQVASGPSLGNVEAGLVASLTSLRFSVVSGGIACVVGTAVVSLAFPALLRYEARASAARA